MACYCSELGTQYTRPLCSLLGHPFVQRFTTVDLLHLWAGTFVQAWLDRYDDCVIYAFELGPCYLPHQMRRVHCPPPRTLQLPIADHERPFVIRASGLNRLVAVLPQEKLVVWKSCSFDHCKTCGRDHLQRMGLYFSFRLHKFVRRVRYRLQRKVQICSQVLPIPSVLATEVSRYLFSRDFVQ